MLKTASRGETMEATHLTLIDLNSVKATSRQHVRYEIESRPREAEKKIVTRLRVEACRGKSRGAARVCDEMCGV